jgi:hypothetical protein
MRQSAQELSKRMEDDLKKAKTSEDVEQAVDELMQAM